MTYEIYLVGLTQGETRVHLHVVRLYPGTLYDDK